MNKLFFVLCLSVCAVLAKHEQYEGYAVYEVTVQDAEQAKQMIELEDQLLLDVWSHPYPKRPGQVLVAKDTRETFQNELGTRGIQYSIISDNIREELLKEDAMLAAAASRSNRTMSGRLALDEIHRYDAVDNYLEELAAQYSHVTLVNAGKSFEGRDIKYLKISTTNFEDTSKPVVYIESLLHAREWVTLPATLYAIHKLVVDVTEQDLLQDIDWIIMPIANPDGYEFTHTESRFWRKNRATGYLIGNLCVGVDLNRNFDVFWATASSNSVCSDTFHGRNGFSEPETAIIRDIILEHNDRLELFLDIHSFGSMILYGYGDGSFPANVLNVHLVGVNMAQEIDKNKFSYNPDYLVGNVYYVLYAASGSAADYSMSAGVPYAYTFELPAARGSSGTLLGFMVWPEFVEQAGIETWEGIKVGVRYARDNYRRRNGF